MWDPATQYAYDPWGATSYTWGASVSNQYGGEPKDASGLIYLRARYYEPGTGRFVSADPFGGTAGNPASQNAYAYAGNNPVNRSDPSGRWAISFSFNLTIGAGAVSVFSFGVAVDGHGTWAVTTTTGYGVPSIEDKTGMLGISVRATGSVGYSPDADTVDDLSGPFRTEGFLGEREL